MDNFLNKLIGGSSMNGMTDQVMATDLLLSAKSGITFYSVALTESATSEVRQILHRHLNEAILMHEKVFNYMHEKGWYETRDVSKLLQHDLQSAQTAANLGNNAQQQ